MSARSVRKVRDGASSATTLAGVTTRVLALGHRLAHQLEGALLGNVAHRTKVLDGLLASSMLLAANDTSVVLHQVFLGQTSSGVFCGSVENLGF